MSTKRRHSSGELNDIRKRREARLQSMSDTRKATGAALTPIMTDVMSVAAQHGGDLIRLPGAYWTWPDCPVDEEGVPEWYAEPSTIMALERRGAVKFTDWRAYTRSFRGNTTYPVAVVVVRQP